MRYRIISRIVNNNFNWIIGIVSNPKFLKSISKEDYIQIERDLAHLQINLLVISIGDLTRSDSKRLNKSLNFNNSTMFLNLEKSIDSLPSSTRRRASIKKQKNKSQEIKNRDIEKIRSLMSNTSSIKTIDENLIYEKF